MGRTTRSTRNKTRWNLKSAARLVDRVGEALLYVKILQQGCSEQVNKKLPYIDALLLEARTEIMNLRRMM